MKVAMLRAGGKKGDSRVSHGPLSKLALAAKLEESGQDAQGCRTCSGSPPDSLTCA